MTDWIERLIEQAGYWGIALLMFLENLFPPIPSEVIMPMGGFVASDGRLAIGGVLAAGVGGALAGALFWYAIGRRLGETRLKRLAARHGRWITLSPEEIDALSRWFRRHRNWAVPLGHLVPGVRTLVSIPAGLFGMNPAWFILLSAVGAGAWTCLLGLAGYALGRNFDSVDRYVGPVGTGMLAAAVAYYLWRVATFRTRHPAD